MNNSILNKVFALFFDTVLTKIKNTSLTWTMKIAHPWASVSMLKVFWGFAHKVWQSNLIEIKTELLHRIYKNSSCDPFLGFGLCFSVFLSQQPATPAVAGCWLIAWQCCWPGRQPVPVAQRQTQRNIQCQQRDSSWLQMNSFYNITLL